MDIQYAQLLVFTKPAREAVLIVHVGHHKDALCEGYIYGDPVATFVTYDTESEDSF